MHILVTGGAGFIGSHLVEYHLHKGDEVHAVDNLSTGSLENIRPFIGNPGFRFTEADILSWKDLNSAMQRADRVYHMAAIVGFYKVLEHPELVLEKNITGCEKILQSATACATKPRIIIASSSSVYGLNIKQPVQEQDLLTFKSESNSLWSYAISKLTEEALALAYSRDNLVHATILRIFNTIGPRQSSAYGMVVPQLIQEALAGSPLKVFGEGTQTRSFCDVRDVVTQIDLLSANPRAIGEIINVGNNDEISINDLAKKILQLVKSDSSIKHIAYQEAYGCAIFEDVPRRVPCLKKLHSFIDYRNRWTLDDTILDIINNLKL